MFQVDDEETVRVAEIELRGGRAGLRTRIEEKTQSRVSEGSSSVTWSPLTSDDGGDISLDSGPGPVTAYINSKWRDLRDTHNNLCWEKSQRKEVWNIFAADCGFIACGEQRVKTRIRIIHP